MRVYLPKPLSRKKSESLEAMLSVYYVVSACGLGRAGVVKVISEADGGYYSYSEEQCTVACGCVPYSHLFAKSHPKWCTVFAQSSLELNSACGVLL